MKLKLIAGPSLAERIWTDATGRFKVKAKLLEHNSTELKLLTDAGKEVTLPLAKLSQEDRDFLESQSGKSENPFE